jgi:predicted ABC-type ATPase
LSAAPAPEIIVLAGTNGAGKSSIVGAALRGLDADYFNPDEATRRILERHPDMSFEDANTRAWRLGRRLLGRAIERRQRFAFETTLGGRTMTGLLLKAANVGMPVRIVYICLESADLHVRRVRARARQGGHDIPEERIRQRYTSSRRNLVRLVPHLAELRVLDNSADADPATGACPEPKLIVHLKAGRLASLCPLDEVPSWAKPIVQATLAAAR